jgi:hypothetical protein
MQIKIDWQEAIPLTKRKKTIIDEKKLLTLVDKRAGVYFFSRKFGESFSPFYIGATISIRGRLKSHWRTAKIQYVLTGIVDPDIVEIKNGDRYFHFGYLDRKVVDSKNT